MSVNIGDIIASDEFIKELKKEMYSIDKYRVLHSEVKFKRGPYDRLKERDLWDPHQIKRMFIDVLNKTGGEPVAIRNFVYILGMKAITYIRINQDGKEKESRDEGPLSK